VRDSDGRLTDVKIAPEDEVVDVDPEDEVVDGEVDPEDELVETIAVAESVSSPSGTILGSSPPSLVEVGMSPSSFVVETEGASSSPLIVVLGSGSSPSITGLALVVDW
jgi:hypothetical protein